MRGHDIKDLKAAISARAAWDRVTMQLTNGNALVCAAIDNAAPGKGIKHIPCPMCGTEKGFRMDRHFESKGTGICNCGSFDVAKLLMRLNGWSLPEVCEQFHEYLYGNGGIGADSLPPVDPAEKARKLEQQKIENARLLKNMRTMWSESVPLDHPSAKPARTYLVSRGLTIRAMSRSLRYHPSQGYYDGDNNLVGRFPVICAKFVNAFNAQATSIHRIYIARDGRGKAPVEDPKKDMAKPSDIIKTGSAIFLDPPAEVMAIGEGIETMLSVRSTYPSLACWATATANMLQAVNLPKGLKRLFIFADLDRSRTGEIVAKELIARCQAENIEVFAFLPGLPIPDGKKGVDWLDVLERCGVGSFPDLPGVPKRQPTEWEMSRLAA